MTYDSYDANGPTSVVHRYDMTPEQDHLAETAEREAEIIRAEIIRSTGKPYQGV